ncbi:MAG: hypothetical protein J0H98_06720 [Solirubrobacterales bacterium]|nr:hypothetical protein [Solirubrobacterales bacterium]
MGAPARVPVLPARRPARQVPRRRPSTRRRPGSRSHSRLRLIGRTAHVVTHLPESGVVRTAATGRRWIAVIGVLLMMIVGINVVTVSYGAMSSKIETQIEGLERQNAILKSSETAALSMPRVQKQAQADGMALPAPDEINYRNFSPSDYAAAAQRLAAGG